MKKDTRERFAALAALLILAVPRAAPAADCYMAADGADTNAGTIDEPFRTFAHAVPLLGPGDTLLVRAGTYAQSINTYDFSITPGESWDNPVTVAAYPGETVVLRPDAGTEVLRIMATSYVVFEGLVLDASLVETNAVKITYTGESNDAHHIRLVGCEVMNAPGQGLLVGSAGSGDGYNEFIGLSVHDNGTTDFDHGFYIGNDYNLVEGCEVYRNSGWGVHIYNGYEGESADHNIVRGNLVHDNAAAGDRGVGIGLYSGTGNAAYNNVSWGNKNGISLNYGLVDALVYNNTVYGNAEYGIIVGEDSTGAQLRNNVVYLSGWGDLEDAGVSTVLGTNLTGTDPLVVDASAGDFHLREGSPAVDAGETLAEVPADLEGVPRPQGEAFDLGAYEYHVGEPDPGPDEGPDEAVEPAPDGAIEPGPDGEAAPDATDAEAAHDAPADVGLDGDGGGEGGGEGCGCAVAS